MATKKTIILIVGMHRSGTSALTGLLGAFGASVPLAANTRINADNPKGHWEHTEANRINDDMLRQFGLTWAAPAVVDPVKVSAKHKENLTRFLRKTIDASSSDIVVYKDPRISLLLPVWLESIAAVGCVPRIVFSYRSPAAVASSLASRNNMGYERGLFLWLEYNLRSILSMADTSCTKLEFPVWMSSAKNLYDSLSAGLEIEWSESWESCEQKAMSFLDPDLVHSVTRQSSGSALGRASDALYSLIDKTPVNISVLGESAEFSKFCDQHLAWLESAATLIQDERSLWREKINSIYYLINRNS